MNQKQLYSQQNGTINVSKKKREKHTHTLMRKVTFLLLSTLHRPNFSECVQFSLGHQKFSSMNCFVVFNMLIFFTINFNRNRVKISYITSAPNWIHPQNVQNATRIWTFCDVFPLSHFAPRMYMRMLTLPNGLVYSIGYSRSMCTETVDNKALGVFYVNAYA